MKRMIILLVVAGVVAGTAMIAVANNGPAEIKLEASMGTVTFNHAAHQGRVAECTTCHHLGVEAGKEVKCTSCHGVKADAPKAKKVFHKTCKGCHKKQNGPTKCKQCHVK